MCWTRKFDEFIGRIMHFSFKKFKWTKQSSVTKEHFKDFFFFFTKSKVYQKLYNMI